MSSVELKSSSPSEDTAEPSSSRTLVLQRYNDFVLDQESQPDKIFIGGYSLRDLDENLIYLDEQAQEHPRSWAFRKKAWATAVVGGFCFLAPFSSTIFAPSVHLVMKDLHITNSTIGALQVSIFLFAFAIGPLFLAPLSERYGRTIILHSGNLFFIAFSIGAGFAQTTAQFSICRLMSGFGGSAALSVIGGLLADIWDLKARPKASGLVTLGPVLGPILGPVCGGWMSEEVSWRWTLWIPAIASACLSAIGFAFLPEPYAPTVLQRKLEKARKTTNSTELYSVLDLSNGPTGVGGLLSDLIRPIMYLAMDPALFLASLFYSIVFGVVYLIIVTFADVFGLGYGHSVGIVGTDFLSSGVGTLIGTFGTIRIMDAVFKRDSQSGQLKYKPESRLISCIPGGILLVGGLFMYGFTALRTHFMVPLIAIAILSVGAMNIMLSVQLYAVDGFKFPASAFAAISFLRCIFAGGFPLFGPVLFQRLGVDWGVALLGFLVLGIGFPLIIVLHIFGPRLRKIGLERMEKLVGSSK
ncbi:MFS general substrate transporter [Pyrenochaeta sp. DS3sAY3a]|nr:MFS general substrate transporter [Pyrenochaeta sp. DS3sAY3a]